MKQGWRCWLLVLLLLLSSGLTACQLNQDNVFPDLPTAGTSRLTPIPTMTPDASASTGETTGEQPLTLTVAGPWTAESLNNLRLLFLAKHSGALATTEGQLIGDTIRISDLTRYEGPLRVELIPVAMDTGATAESIRVWKAAGNLPDLMYVSQAGDLADSGSLLDLASYLADDDRLSANVTYPSLLTANMSRQRLLAVPYLVSVPLVCFNQSLLNQYSIPSPAAQWTWSDCLDLCASLQAAFKSDGRRLNPADLQSLAANPAALTEKLQQACFPLANPQALLQYWPACLDARIGLASWDGRHLNYDQPAFAAAVQSLQTVVKAGYSPLHLTTAQSAVAWTDSPLQNSGRIALWIDDSANLSAWQLQSKIAFNFVPLPDFASDSPAQTGSQAVSQATTQPTGANQGQPTDAQTSQTTGQTTTRPAGETVNQRLLARRQPVVLRSLAVSSRTATPELAAEFAAFLALDPDALLLQARLQRFDGFYPSINNQMLWQMMVQGQQNGSQMMDLRSRLAYAYTGGALLQTVWPTLMAQTVIGEGERILTDDTAVNRLNDWQKLADKLTGG